MRSRSLAAAFALLSPFILTSASFGLAHLKAGSIDGSQEVPPVASGGTGIAHCLVDTGTNTLFYHIEYSGLTGTETGAHFHGFVPAGSNGGVVHGLPLGSPKIGAWVYPEANEASILSGLIYVNIHSSVAGGGEIRGQVSVDTATNMVAIIDPGQEVPPTASTGQGIGVFVIDTGANTLSYEVRFGGLVATETAAHIHGYVPAGTNGGVVNGLGVGNPKIGVWNYLEANEGNIVGGLTYVNIHSSMFGGGEIRGQILPMSPATDAPVLGPDSGTLSLSAAPNPVPDGTTVALMYRLPAPSDVSVTIHDVSGRTIRTLSAESDGAGILAWDTQDESGGRVAAGVYFARLQSGLERETKRIVVLR